MNRTRTGSRPTRKVRWAPPDRCDDGHRRIHPWRSTIDSEGHITGSYQCPTCREIFYRDWEVETL